MGSKEPGLPYKAQSCVSLVVQELDIALSGFGPGRDLRILHLGFQNSPETGGDPRCDLGKIKGCPLMGCNSMCCTDHQSVSILTLRAKFAPLLFMSTPTVFVEALNISCLNFCQQLNSVLASILPPLVFAARCS